MDLGRIVALTWLLVALGISILVGPELGWRGWLWLGTHNLLCLVGASHELWRKRKGIGPKKENGQISAS